MTVRVRMAPSPTGFLHIGGVRTFLFNWLFARHHGGEILLRIENTDTSREVEEATDQIQSSLHWLGIDWDGPVSFQLDTADRARELARRLVDEGKAYEDDGAIRFRQPRDGTVAWDDAVRGRIEFRNDQLDDLVILRSDGRPTYNFVSPVDDVEDRITHVIRGDDHVSNTPTQINILRALGGTCPCTRTSRTSWARTGEAVEAPRRRRRSTTSARRATYAPALMNFLALLGWSYDDKTTIMSRDDSSSASRSSASCRARPRSTTETGLAERRVPPRPAAGRVRDALCHGSTSRGTSGRDDLVRATVPLVQEKLE